VLIKIVLARGVFGCKGEKYVLVLGLGDPPIPKNLFFKKERGVDITWSGGEPKDKKNTIFFKNQLGIFFLPTNIIRKPIFFVVP